MMCKYITLTDKNLITGFISNASCGLVKHILKLCGIIKNKSMKMIRPKTNNIYQGKPNYNIMIPSCVGKPFNETKL